MEIPNQLANDINKLKQQIATKICKLVRDTNDAATPNFEEQLNLLLVQQYADLNYPATKGWTAMHFACKLGKSNIIKLLLNHGATIYVPCNDTNLNPIDYLTLEQKEMVKKYLQREYKLYGQVLKIKNNKKQNQSLSPIEEFILTLTQYAKETDRELSFINANDSKLLKKHYMVEHNESFIKLESTLRAIWGEKFLVVALRDLCNTKKELYELIIETILKKQGVKLVDETYRRMWIDVQRFENAIEGIVTHCNDTIHQKNIKGYQKIHKNDFNFAVSNMRNFYKEGLQLLESHISAVMRTELHYTKLEISNNNYIEVKLSCSYDIVAAYNKEYRILFNNLLNVFEPYIESKEKDLYFMYIRESGSQLIVELTDFTTNFNNLTEAGGNFNSQAEVRAYFIKLSSLVERMKLHCKIFTQYSQYLAHIEKAEKATQQKIPIEIKTAPTAKEDIQKASTPPILSAQDYKQQLEHKLKAWKAQVEATRQNKPAIISADTLSLVKEIKNNSKEYLTSYPKGELLNPEFNNCLIKCDYKMLEDIIVVHKINYTIIELQNFISSIGGKYRLSSKNHLLYWIPDLYALGDKIKYITDCIALPSKSNAKQDSCVAECYILNLKNNLISAGLDKKCRAANNYNLKLDL